MYHGLAGTTYHERVLRDVVGNARFERDLRDNLRASTSSLSRPDTAMTTFPQPLSALRVVLRGVSPLHSRPWHVWSITDHFERSFGKVVACHAPRVRLVSSLEVVCLSSKMVQQAGPGRRYRPFILLDFASPASAAAAVDACEKRGGQLPVEVSENADAAENGARFACNLAVERARQAHDE